MVIKSCLNDLPKYSPWPARLLGLTDYQQRHKTPQEITREYEHEKWGALLDKVHRFGKAVTLDEIDKWALDTTQEILCSIQDDYYRMNPLEAHERYLNLVDDYLSDFLPATSLVELGAGYGSIILGLGKKSGIREMNILAAEYTNSGIDLIKHVARAERLKITVDRCDFSAVPITNLPISSGAIIFTSYATPYVPIMPDSFVHSLAGFDPSVVIHFEPCYEHCDQNTLIGMLRRRYIEINDYNRNLVTLLQEHETKGTLKILKEERSLFGNNPLLPISVIAWKPNK